MDHARRAAQGQKVELLLRLRKANEAEREARDYVAAYPDAAEGYVYVAQALDLLNRLDDALVAVRTGLGKSSHNPWPHCVYASLLLRVKRFDSAREALREARRIDPHYVWSYELSAHLNQERGLFKKAYAATKRGLRLDPEHVGLRNLKAWSEMRLGKLDRATESAQRALAIDPDRADVHHTLGCIEWHRADAVGFVQAFPLFRKAERHFREAMRLDAENTIQFENRKEFLYATRRDPAALIALGLGITIGLIAFVVDVFFRVPQDEAHPIFYLTVPPILFLVASLFGVKTLVHGAPMFGLRLPDATPAPEILVARFLWWCLFAYTGLFVPVFLVVRALVKT